MVSATLVDVLASPSDALKELYEKYLQDGAATGFPKLVTTHFSAAFSDESAFDQVRLPFLEIFCSNFKATHD